MSFLDKLFAKKPKKPEFVPYKVENELGKFEMEYYCEKPLYAYTGVISFPEAKELDGISVEIGCDSNETFEMERGLTMLRRVLRRRDIWVEKAKQYTADNFLSEDMEGMVEIYGGGEHGLSAFVTVEEYKALLSPVHIDIPGDGNIYIELDGDYKDYNMFSDHGFGITFDERGNIIGGE